jgi:hypothetical protein
MLKSIALLKTNLPTFMEIWIEDGVLTFLEKMERRQKLNHNCTIYSFFFAIYSLLLMIRNFDHFSLGFWQKMAQIMEKKTDLRPRDQIGLDAPVPKKKGS